MIRTASFSLMIVLALSPLNGCAAVRYAEDVNDAVDIPDTYGIATTSDAEAPQVCQALPGPAATELLRLVDAGNLDLATAAARLRQAEALAAAAGATLWPRVDVGVNGARGTGVFSNTGAGAPDPVTVYQGSAAASFEVDIWGRLRNQRAAAVLDAHVAAASLDALAITLNATAADTWFTLQAQRYLVALLKEQQSASRSFLELTRLRFTLGQAPAQDIGRQRQQLLDIEGQIEAASANEAVLATQLALLAGLPPDAISIASLKSIPVLPSIPDPGVPAALADARPDVRAARLALEAADRRTAAAVANRLPSLSMSASLVSIEQALSDVFGDVLWSAGAGAGVSIFDGGALAAGADAAEANAQAALAEYAATLLSALQEVSAALIRNDSQDRIVDNIAAQLEEADKVLVLTREGYRRGQASYLDVLGALLSKQGLERQRVDAIRQQFSNRIALCRALGQPVGEFDAAARVADAKDAK